MDRTQFKERLEAGTLLMDGAMGTVLHSRGIPIDDCFDAVNLSQPSLVAEVHRDYIEAGSDIIETNTFGANSYKLSKFGLERQVAAINSAAVEVARRVIDGSYKDILLAGSVGPLGVRLAPLGRVKRDQAQSAFREQVEALIKPHSTDARGVDLIIVETHSDLSEIEAAVKAIREISADLPVVAMMTFTRDDRTLLGDTPASTARRLAALDVDAIGVNCSSGPVQVLRIATTFRELMPDLPLAASPNAGWPRQLEGGRVLFSATANYFGDCAVAFAANGISIIGGCCGTGARHIAAMRAAIDDPGRTSTLLIGGTQTRSSRVPGASTEEPSALARDLESGKFVVTVEMSPPRGVAAERLIEGARMLKEAGATYADVADSPLARMRMSAWAAAYLLQKEVGLEAILHFPTRGRNLLRIQGDLLAAHTLGIRNLFVIMGDPTKIGDFPEAMDDYDIVPSGLIKLIKEQLNLGMDQAGQLIDQPTSFVVGAALNLEAANVDREIRLLRKKMRNGADFMITQPVFNVERARAFLATFRKRMNVPLPPIIVGIQPLFNSGNAEFLHNEVPGISIPDRYRDRLRAAADAQQTGVEIAREILEDLRPEVNGVYVVPAFGRYDLVADVLDSLA